MSFILNLEEMETEEEADQSWGGSMSQGRISQIWGAEKSCPGM